MDTLKNINSALVYAIDESKEKKIRFHWLISWCCFFITSIISSPLFKIEHNIYFIKFLVFIYYFAYIKRGTGMLTASLIISFLYIIYNIAADIYTIYTYHALILSLFQLNCIYYFISSFQLRKVNALRKQVKFNIAFSKSLESEIIISQLENSENIENLNLTYRNLIAQYPLWEDQFRSIYKKKKRTLKYLT